MKTLAFALKRMIAPAILALTLSSLANSETLVSAPLNPAEYKNIFGYLPNENELKNIQAIHAENTGKSFIKSEAELAEKISTADHYLIIIGHNEEGFLKFANGDEKSIKEIATQADELGKISIFLTCHGQCYTDKPATRFKTTFDNAIILADKINESFENFANIDDVPPQSHPIEPLPNGGGTLTAAECARLFATTRATPRMSSANGRLFASHVSKVIMKAEITGIATSSAKYVGMLGAGSLLFALQSEDQP